jgi:hypothetical protein
MEFTECPNIWRGLLLLYCTTKSHRQSEVEERKGAEYGGDRRSYNKRDG